MHLYQQAITFFQQAGDQIGEMHTCDLLGSAERQREHFDAAEAWYARSREMARNLNDQAQLAVIAQNVGILYQTRAEQSQDPAERERMSAAAREAAVRRFDPSEQAAAVEAVYGTLGGGRLGSTGDERMSSQS